MPTTTPPHNDHETLTAMNRLLVKTLRALSDSGRNHEACELAAEGWSLLRSRAPHEAERLNGLLHYLTAPSKKKNEQEVVNVRHSH